jgi:hypothetical protein
MIFQCVIELNLGIFHGEYLHLCSSRKLVYGFLYCILIGFWHQGSTGFSLECGSILSLSTLWTSLRNLVVSW